MRRLLITIVVLAVLGVGTSSYALWQHYLPLDGSGFCNFGETFSCDLVNKSAFSEVFGIPVAGIGIAGYLALFALALGACFDRNISERAGEHRVLTEKHPMLRSPLAWMLALSILGLIFSAYLTYVELFIIGAICVLCVTSQTLIFVITGAGYAGWRRARSEREVPMETETEMV